MALGWILFAKGDRHLTAEMLYEEATKAKVPVSLATVYNTLHQFTDVGLLRQVAVDGSKTYFDTNTTAHHHFFVEGDNALVDIPGAEEIVEQDAGALRPATRSPASTWWSACARRASSAKQSGTHRLAEWPGSAPGHFVFLLCLIAALRLQARARPEEHPRSDAAAKYGLRPSASAMLRGAARR